MADSDQPKLVEWNLRNFPEDVKIKCQQLALEKKYEINPTGKKVTDAQVVAFYLRKGMGLENSPPRKKAS